ncbi:MAG: hypothetical protein WC657_02800 [Candidatus Paceibacterota bacterium]|jgi:hypothetical protein
MALTPGDLVLSIAEVSEADRLEVLIDKRLKAEYVAGCKISVPMGSTPIRVRNELIRRYKIAGWKKIEYSPFYNKIEFEN